MKNLRNLLIGTSLLALSAFASAQETETYKTPNLIQGISQQETAGRGIKYSTQAIKYRNERAFLRNIDKAKDLVLIDDKPTTNIIYTALTPAKGNIETITPNTKTVSIDGENYIPVSVGKRTLELLGVVKFNDENTTENGIYTRTTRINPLQIPTITINGQTFYKLSVNDTEKNTLPIYLARDPEIEITRNLDSDTGKARLTSEFFQPRKGQIINKREYEAKIAEKQRKIEEEKIKADVESAKRKALEEEKRKNQELMGKALIIKR